jgi:glycine dehydrogenase subunit 1
VTTALLGETGRRLAAELSASKAHALAGKIVAEVPGVALADPEAPFFREFLLRLPPGTSADEVVTRMGDEGFLAGIPTSPAAVLGEGGGEGLLVAVTEKRLWSELDAYVDALRRVVAGVTAPETQSIG